MKFHLIINFLMNEVEVDCDSFAAVVDIILKAKKFQEFRTAEVWCDGELLTTFYSDYNWEMLKNEKD